MSAEENRTGRTREKSTAIDRSLPAVSKIAEGKPTFLRYVDLDGNDQTLDFSDLMVHDPWPIPLPVDREGYGSLENSHQFWATGYGDWLNVHQAIQRYCSTLPQRLFDFGCATGRFLRHASTFGQLQTAGCDFAPANVDWVARHLPAELNVILNTDEPRLPFPDQHFDVVTAFSVFTHIDADEQQWLLELRRITRPDGLLYLTIQNQATWDRVLDRPGSLAHLQSANRVAGNLPVDDALFRQPMPAHRIVFRMSAADIYNCNVWLTDQYIQQFWSPHFEILQIAANAHTCFQSPVILRPKRVGGP